MQFSRGYLFGLGLGLLAMGAISVGAQSTVTFEELPLSGSNSFWNGSDGSGGFQSEGVDFNNDFNSEWGSWSGFAYSNLQDATTPGFGNQYAAMAGAGGEASANYAIVYTSGSSDVISLGVASRVWGVQVNNTTYTALSMRDGDSFSKKFGGADGTDPDWLRLTVTGKDGQGEVTGNTEFFLADYRFDESAEDYILEDWAFLDLTGLGGQVSQLEFAMESSDMGEWGMNTPAYFALDNLVFTPVPEPSTAVLLGLAGVAGLALRRRVRG